jgi:FkbM family methyltransferase
MTEMNVASIELEKALCRYGVMTWPVQDPYVGKSLSVYGEWAQNEIDFCSQFISSTSVILDIGGNIGTHAIAFSHLSPSGRVISLEPHPALWPLLEANVASCCNANVELHNVAASDNHCGSFMSSFSAVLGEANYGGLSLLDPKAGNHANDHEHVPTVTIDSLNLSILDFVKIDVEGCEPSVLRGMFGTLKRTRSVLLCEVLTIETSLDLFNIVNGLGFDVYFVSFDPFSRNNFRDEWRNIFSLSREHGLLFVPKEKGPPDPLHAHQLTAVNDCVSLVQAFVNATDTSRKIAAKLYFKEDGSYSEHNSSYHLIENGSIGIETELIFSLPSAKRMTALRLEISGRFTVLDYLDGWLEGTRGTKSRLWPSECVAGTRSGDTFIWIDSKPMIFFDSITEGHYRSARLKIKLLAHNNLLADGYNISRDFTPSKKVPVGICFSEKRQFNGPDFLMNEAVLCDSKNVLPTIDHTENVQPLRRNVSPIISSKKEEGATPPSKVPLNKLSGRLGEKLPRDATPDEAQSFCDPGCLRNEPLDLIEIVRSEFDASFYLDMYPDVAAAGLNPLEHYVHQGWWEGRDPNPNFSTRYYLEHFPSVVEAGLNPLYHWVSTGKPSIGLKGNNELRQILIENCYTNQAIDPAVWDAFKTLSPYEFAEALMQSLDPKTPRIALSFGHDNYTVIVGGIQNICGVEQTACNANKTSYLQLHPAVHSPEVLGSEHDGRYVLGVVLDGAGLGYLRSADLSLSLDILTDHGIKPTITLVIHALMGHSPNFISTFSERIDSPNAFFWLHDYYSLCPSYNLMRNNIQYCNAPPPESGACSVCIYGEERKKHLFQFQDLFNTYDFNILAPSQTALDIWRGRSNLPHRNVRVIPHLHLDQVGSKKPVRDNLPLRVAFVGLPRFHKGWKVYSKLVQECKGDDRYSFYLIGKEKRKYPPMNWREVTVLPEDRNAMCAAIAEEEIDVAIFFSIWPETFCISAFESSSSGAYLLTTPDSGNVAAEIENGLPGLILADEAELLQIFETGEIIERVRSEQSKGLPISRLRFSRVTFEMFRGEG